MYDLVLRGATVVSESTQGACDLAVTDGVVAAVLPAGSAAVARSYADLDGLTLLPGLVDAHVHFRGSPRDAGESFAIGSAAAAAGGVTTVLEMPVTDPMVLTGRLLRERGNSLSTQSIGDFALYGGLGVGNLHEAAGLRAAGAVGVKTFLHRAGPGREGTLGAITAVTTDEMLRVLEAGASAGLVHAIHAEDDGLIGFLQAQHRESDPATFHLSSRPTLAEDVSAVRAAIIGMAVGASMHFVHVSSALTVDLLGFLVSRGADLSIETAPHYVRFTSAQVSDFGMRARCNPPLRSPQAQADLIRRLDSGAIDVVASDHCSYPIDDVRRLADDPVRAPAGFPGIQYMLPSLLNLVSEGRLSLSQVVRATSLAPARRFSLARKGDVAVGMDADFVVVDLDAPTPFADLPHQSAAVENVPFFGTEVYSSRVAQTWVRGTCVFDGSSIRVGPGHGRWLKPAPRQGGA
ncbi:dihydroorotase [Sphaerimonospora sp. CA-214678]|uniref:dihydroorotase n=1 Tax=Sphaerimonospora sp. CA-214678 TaxID=3240029 RepID=UPI003D93F1F0